MEYLVCHGCGTKKKHLSLQLESNALSPIHRLDVLTTEVHVLGARLVTSEVIFTRFLVTRVLHFGRISNVEIIFSGEISLQLALHGRF